MPKTSTYNVDLTVQEVSAQVQNMSPSKEPEKVVTQSDTPPSGNPRGPEQGSKVPVSSTNADRSEPQYDANADAAKQAKSPKVVKEHKGKHAKKGKKSKKDKKGKRSSGSSSDSSSSSSSSDDESGTPEGVRRALEAWRYPFYSPSASYRQVDVIAGSHQYTISGFSLAHTMGCGTRLCSDFFEVGGQLFRLEVYPAGFTADTRKYISAFLTTPGSINPNHIMYEIAVLDQTGKDKHIAVSRAAARELEGPMLSYCRGIVAAVPKLAKAKHLAEKAKRYLPNDMLVIRATVQVLRGWSSTPSVHTHVAACGPCASMGMYAAAPPLGPTLPAGTMVSSGTQPLQTRYGVPQQQYTGSSGASLPVLLQTQLQLQPASTIMGAGAPPSPGGMAQQFASPGSYSQYSGSGSYGAGSGGALPHSTPLLQPMMIPPQLGNPYAAAGGATPLLAVPAPISPPSPTMHHHQQPYAYSGAVAASSAPVASAPYMYMYSPGVGPAFQAAGGLTMAATPAHGGPMYAAAG